MPSPEEILAPLNPEQRAAAEAVRGPVAVIAGAGTGKTTTITHRIAAQIASSAFAASSILAVTFTEKAARELKERLARLGAEGVVARTFHAAGLAQLSRLWPELVGDPLPEILPSKAPLIASLANALPPPHRFLPRGELANEIEWAKNRLVPPERYLAEVDDSGHEPPIPAELMHRVYDGYERRKQRASRIDFEDMLGLLVRLLDERPEAAERVRARFHAFTVDEYQDVNPLQHALLDRWLGGREELCVVGDDHQTIYSFTGATPEYLLSFPERYPGAAVVRLEENYRSTPQVLTVANALGAHLGGFHKQLRSTVGDGPAPTARWLPDAEAEVRFVVEEIRRLHGEGVPYDEMAVLYRINARSEPFEEAFAAAAIPYQVRDGSFLRRPGPRSVIARLRRSSLEDVVLAVEEATNAVGFDPHSEPDDAEEVTRQADLARLRALASEFASSGSGGGVSTFLEELARRFSTEHAGRGVNLLTFHRAKGLEFEAVFLPRLLDRELPFRSGRAAADPDEERRLLYVGITRARRHLYLSWPAEQKSQPSPFLSLLGVSGGRPTPSPRRERRPVATAAAADGPLFERLRTWRAARARADGVPAYVVFNDATLREIADRRPTDWADLAGISGVGPVKLERYADEVLGLVRSA
ncbi:MAG TPA: ATP-dependent DNA helicase UvrD2 [Actinomycetota bacterium]